YTSHIRTAIQELNLPIRRIQYEVEALASAAAAGHGGSALRSAGGRASSSEPTFENGAAWLNPRLTFDTYVVGASNNWRTQRRRRLPRCRRAATIPCSSMAASGSARPT